MTAVQQRNVLDGTLKVSLRLDGDSRVVAFAGELDLANAGTADAELAAALDPATARVVIDLAELEFIDSTGIALLVSVLRRCDGEREVRFVPSRCSTAPSSADRPRKRFAQAGGSAAKRAAASSGSTKTSPRTKRPASSSQIQAAGMSRIPSSWLRR